MEDIIPLKIKNFKVLNLQKNAYLIIMQEKILDI